MCCYCKVYSMYACTTTVFINLLLEACILVKHNSGVLRIVSSATPSKHHSNFTLLFYIQYHFAFIISEWILYKYCFSTNTVHYTRFSIYSYILVNYYYKLIFLLLSKEPSDNKSFVFIFNKFIVGFKRKVISLIILVFLCKFR